jgi:cytochrome c
MDSMEVNKGIAAVLVAGIAFFLTGLIGDNLVRQTVPEKPVLNIATAPTAPTGGGEAKPAGPAPIAPLLASADAKSGDQFAHKICVACHTFDKGGKPGVGPNLYGIVGAPHDHEDGFNYSPAMQKFKGQPWTYDALNDWLFKPSAYAPGTRMTFAGITSDKQRADVIAYLRSLSDSPEPLPSPQEAQQAAPPAGAAGGEKPAEPKAPAPSSEPAAAPATPPKP